MGHDIRHDWLPNSVEIVKRKTVYGVRFMLNNDRTKKIFTPPQEPIIELETAPPPCDSKSMTFWTKPEDIDILLALFGQAVKGLEAAFEHAYPDCSEWDDPF